MGSAHSSDGLQDRILQDPAFFGSFQVNSGAQSSGPTSSSRERNLSSSSERCSVHRQKEFSGQTPPVLLLPHSQETRHLETNPKPETSKQAVHPSKKVQNGDTRHNPPVSSTRILGNIDRSKRCLPSHPHPSVPSQISGVPVQGDRLLLSGDAVRPLNCPQSFYTSNKSDSGFPAKKGNTRLRLSRRLASHRTFGQRSLPHYKLHPHVVKTSRLGGQRGEIVPHSKSKGYLPRGSPGPSLRRCLSYPRESSDINGHGYSDVILPVSSSQTLASTLGPHGQYGGCYPVLQIVYEAGPDTSPTVLRPIRQSSLESCPIESGRLETPSLVDSSTQCGLGETLRGNSPQIHYHDRRLFVRLGSSMGISHDLRPLEHLPVETPHQPLGDGGGPPSSHPLETPPQGAPAYSPVRQLDHSLLHQSPRGNEVPLSLSKDLGPTSSMQTPQHFHQGDPPCRPGERDGRRPLQGNPSGNRMVSVPGLGQSHIQHFRPSDDRPLRIPDQCQVTNLLHQVFPSTGVGYRCSSNFLGQSPRLRIPSVVPNSKSPPEAQSLQRNSTSRSPLLAEPTMVPDPPGDAHRSSVQIPNQGQPTHSERGQDLAPTTSASSSCSLETFIRQLSSQGLSQEAAVLASGSRRSSTVSTYNSRLSRFRTWCSERNTDPMEASLESVADFLLHIFKEGKQVSTVKNYRSAISSIHEGFPDGSTIGSNNAINHLLRGMFNERPPQKRLSPSWSINDVLNSLSTSPFEPIHNTSLELLTHKTLFLLAAASARRRSELHALTTKRGFIRFSHNGVYLIPDPTFLTKNETASFSPGEIYLPNISSASSIREDRKICPVRALRWYIEKTKNIRSSERLFLIPRSPYNPASKDTLSRWIVNLITPHIDNDDPVHAHQLRAHATSKAWFNGVSLSDILKAAAWKTPSTFVSCYLTDVVSNEGAFARSVLGISDQHRRPVLPPSCRC